jgi:hypothetical protein
MMPRAICEDCGSLVEAELTHNGICAVGHYVHCGWGHELSPDDLISDDVAEIISKLETKLTKAMEALRGILKGDDMYPWRIAREILVELEGGE